MPTITDSGPILPERDEAPAPAAAGPSSGEAAGTSSPVPVRPAPAPASTLHVPGDTTPTWELEMLVSGAVLYGLFQLPPVVDGAWRTLSVRMVSDFAHTLAGLGFLYVKASVYALTLTFVVHLLSRAYWVALVGVDSVFPAGIQWDRTRSYGPITRELFRDRVPALSNAISRLDNFCSVAFAVGFAAVSSVLSILVLLLAVSGLAWGVAQLFFGGRGLEYIFPGAFVVIMLPIFALLADRRFGERVRADGWLARSIRLLVRLNPRMVGLGALGALSLTLSTNLGGRRVRLVTFGLLGVSFGIAFAQLQQSKSSAAFALLPGLPSTLRPQARQYRHYADQRTGGDVYAPVPFIQSDVVQGPYVRLFVPYVPERDEYELSACRRARAASAAPSAAATSGTSAGAAASVASDPQAGAPSGRGPSPSALAPDEDEIVVRCLGGIYNVSIDGRAAAIDYRFYTDAASGLQGILGYVPTAGLPRGGNVLVVRRPRPDADTPRPSPYVIPFWL